MFKLRVAVATAAMILCLIIGLTDPPWSAAQTPPTFFGAYGMWMQSPMPTWEDVAWLRGLWPEANW